MTLYALARQFHCPSCPSLPGEDCIGHMHLARMEAAREMNREERGNARTWNLGLYDEAQSLKSEEIGNNSTWRIPKEMRVREIKFYRKAL